MDSMPLSPRKSINPLLRLWLWLGLGNKSPWDYVQLLILPVLFVSLSYYLNKEANDRQQKEVDARFQQGVVKDYYDVITRLVLESDLASSAAGQPVADVAKAYTFNVLETVDGSRKRGLVQFLYGLKLIKTPHPVLTFEAGSTAGRYDFNRVGFSSADLSGMYLWNARLACTDMQKTNLQNTSLVRSDLHAADLRRADLRNARLMQSDLRNALLIEADLSQADLSGANLIGAKLNGCTMSGTIIKNAIYSNNTLWPEGFAPKSHGAKCICPNADLRNAKLHGKMLQRVDLRNADLTGADLRGSSLEEAKLTNAVLSGANLQNTAFQRADFTGAKLERANLKGAYAKQAVFENAIFCQTTMPDGSIKNDDCPANGN